MVYLLFCEFYWMNIKKRRGVPLAPNLFSSLNHRSAIESALGGTKVERTS